MTNGISKIRRVPLREVWKHEAYDFTRWLEQNVDVLNDALGIDLISAEREQAAGPFSIDLVAEDSCGDSYVIENQLEKSNHDHLGKLITYFTSMDAKGGIWIVSEPRPEHVAAIAWLNEATDAKFYLVIVEAIRIDESPAAPLLTLIVGPSEEAKEVGRVKREIASHHLARRRWWEMLLSRPDAHLHAHRNPWDWSWMSADTEIPGLTLNYRLTKTTCRVDLHIERKKYGKYENERIFDQLLEHRAEIESKVSFPLEWDKMELNKSCEIRTTIPGGHTAPEEQWPEIQGEAVRAMNELEAALKPLLPRLQLTVR